LTDTVRSKELSSEAGLRLAFLFCRLGDMDKKIDKLQVKKVAKLARLDLSTIIGYVERMNKLNTEGIEPLAHCLPISNVFREDIVKESLGTEKTLANAPQRDGTFFKVPKILEEP
jgi:aspartyl-tRNA(Asn)/glutamyl-tRNA(Gln) amidotransferase subunit C